MISHVCEEAWEKLGNGGFVSSARWPEAEEGLVDKQAEAQEDYLDGVVADARKVMEFAKIKPTRAVFVTASQTKCVEFAEAIRQESIDAAVKKISDENLRKMVGKNFFKFRELGFVEFDEHALLAASIAFLSKQIGAPVTVEKEEDSAEGKKTRAMPLKPAIILK